MTSMRASGTAWAGSSSPERHPEECARREVFEESGLQVVALNLKGVLTFPLFSSGEDWYVFVFTAQYNSGSVIQSREGDLEWIDDDKLCELELWEGDQYFLPWLDQPGFFSAKFTCNNGSLTGRTAVFYH